MKEFGKRKTAASPSPIVARADHRHRGWLASAATAVVVFLGGYAAMSLGLSSPWLRHLVEIFPSYAKRPAGAAGSPLEFLKGRWVANLASCTATDNYAEFRDDGYVAFVHGRRWADISNHVLYWRKGDTLFIKEDGNQYNPILSLKMLDDDHIAFLNLAFEGEEEYDRGGPKVTEQPQPPGRVPEFVDVRAQLEAQNRGTTLEDEWRASFRTYLATLKRCAQTKPSSLASSPASEVGATEFLNGTWVSRNATCDATDNLASFSEKGFEFKIHGHVFGRNISSPVNYWRTGDTISIGIGRMQVIARISFRVINADELDFADFNVEADRILHPEKDWAFSGNSGNSNDALVTNEWRQLFADYLPRLKRCPRKT